MLSGTGWGLQNTAESFLMAISRSRAAQGSSPEVNQVIGCLFFGSFLWASKEMNIKKC
jgi:hypothetical protein